MTAITRKAAAAHAAPRRAGWQTSGERPSTETGAIEEAVPSGVQSIGRAFAILEEVARNREGIGLSELCRRVGLHSSTTFHLIKTMVSLGYVRQLKDSKRYRLGRPIFLLAAQSLDEIEMVNVAMPFLEEIAEASDESAIFGVRLNSSLAVLARAQGHGPFQATDQVGTLRPLHATAAGKQLLAALSTEQLALYLERTSLEAFTSRTLTTTEALRREIQEIRRSGIATEDGEFRPEVHSIAVGIHDFTARQVGVLSLSGPSWRMTAERMQGRVDLLRKAAERLSLQFGYDVGLHSGC